MSWPEKIIDATPAASCQYYCVRIVWVAWSQPAQDGDTVGFGAMLPTTAPSGAAAKNTPSTSVAKARATLHRAVRIACVGEETLPPDELDEQVWAEAAHAGLVPLVASSLAGGSARAPEHVRETVLQTAMQHLRTVADLRALAAALDHAGVRWLVVKGPVLAEVVYRDPSVRAYGDLDIVVHPKDLGRALDVLTDAGALLLDRNWEHIRSTQQSEISLELRWGTMLDLHWHFITNPRTRADIALAMDKVFDAAIWVEVGGQRVRTLSHVDTLCYVSLHAALAGGHQLRWLVDVQQCLSWARLHLDAVPSRARDLGCDLALAVMLRRVATHLAPSVATTLRSVRVRNLWYLLCVGVDRLAPLDPQLHKYSGRAVLSSTRRTSVQSMRALVRTVRAALKAGKARRGRVNDAAILRLTGGDASDRAAWIEMARQEAS